MVHTDYIIENDYGNDDRTENYNVYIVQPINRSCMRKTNENDSWAVSDSGANIPITNTEIAHKMGFTWYRWDKSIGIKFGNSTVEYSEHYIYCGLIVGSGFVKECT
jgi:hypothetical protein